jgi:hypothetical protein
MKIRNIAPVREDGFIEYVNKRFKPQREFQQEEGEELEAVWNASLGRKFH